MPKYAPELWPPGFAAWIKIAICYQKGGQRLAAGLRPLELTVAQFDALANLYLEDGISQQQLAHQLLVTKGNLTGLIGRLADRELVTRSADPNDGRAYRVKLTKTGRRLTRRALEVQRRLVSEMMGALDLAERETLRKLLTRVVGQLEEQEAQPAAAKQPRRPLTPRVR